MPSLRTLEPAFRGLAQSFYDRMRHMWPGLVVTSAKRTHAEQTRLYEEFLRTGNAGLPVARPGTSDHEVGLAFDMAHPGIDPLQDTTLRLMGALWKQEGGRWSERDPVHFAAPNYIADFHPRGLAVFRRRRRR